MPDDGQYTLKFEATDQGSFDFKIRNYTNDVNDKTILYKNVPLTQLTRIEATFDTTSSESPILQIDSDGDSTINDHVGASASLTGNAINDQIPPVTTIQSAGIKGNDDWHKSDVIITLSAQDEASGSGILKTEYSLNDGKTLQNYSGPFIISEKGTTRLKFRSIDKAGNEEAPREKEIKIENTPAQSQVSGASAVSTQEPHTSETTTGNDAEKIPEVKQTENRAARLRSVTPSGEVAGVQTESRVQPKEKKPAKTENSSEMLPVILAFLSIFSISKKRQVNKLLSAIRQRKRAWKLSLKHF